MKVDGEKVGQVRLNFEPDGDGIAFRFLDRSREKKTGTIIKGGERVKSDAKVTFDIPAD